MTRRRVAVGGTGSAARKSPDNRIAQSGAPAPRVLRSIYPPSLIPHVPRGPHAAPFFGARLAAGRPVSHDKRIRPNPRPGASRHAPGTAAPSGTPPEHRPMAKKPATGPTSSSSGASSAPTSSTRPSGMGGVPVEDALVKLGYATPTRS